MSESALVAGVEVKIAGVDLDPLIAAAVLEVRLENHLHLPDTVSIRIADEGLEHVDSKSFDIGRALEVSFAGPRATEITKLFDGEITAFEPEFTEREVVLAIRAYDRSHRLNRGHRTATYEQMSPSDIARKIAVLNGLSAGTISSSEMLPFVQQSNETDWSFLRRLAAAIGFELSVQGQALNFRKPAVGQRLAATLAWGTTLLSFRPRVTAAGQVGSVEVHGWDPSSKQAIVGMASAPDVQSKIGHERGAILGKFRKAQANVVDQPVTTTSEANRMAQSVADRLGNGYVEAEGTAIGDGRLTPGATIDVEGVGERFGGTYTLTETVHLVRPGRGYQTHFRVSGQAIRSLTELSSPRSAAPSWRNSVVVGVVTSNNDPDGLGRVRVQFPVLGDTAQSWWARIASPSAGANRGLLMMPVVHEEVLVAFEHGDDGRPYVIGSLWNGRDTPQTLVQTDGSFVLQSDKKVTTQASEAITVTGQKNIELTATEDIIAKASGNLQAQAQSTASVQAAQQLNLKGEAAVNVQGQQVTVQGTALTKISAGGEVTIEGSGAVSIKGASIQIQASGPVQISAPMISLG
jgi:uncharacterized protein involved in type VI secretion and phage assembly